MVFPYFEQYLKQNGGVEEREEALRELARIRSVGRNSKEPTVVDSEEGPPQGQKDVLDVQSLSLNEIDQLIQEELRRADAVEDDITQGEDTDIATTKLETVLKPKDNQVSYKPSGHTLRVWGEQLGVNPRPPVVDTPTWVNTSPKVRLEYLCNYRQTLNLRCTTDWPTMRTWLLEEHAPELLPTGHKFPWDSTDEKEGGGHHQCPTHGAGGRWR